MGFCCYVSEPYPWIQWLTQIVWINWVMPVLFLSVMYSRQCIPHSITGGSERKASPDLVSSLICLCLLLRNHDFINWPMWVRIASLVVLPSHNHGWSSLVGIQSGPFLLRCSDVPQICLHSLDIHTLGLPLPPGKHTCHTQDVQVYVFPEYVIFSSHEWTTGGTRCYINASCFTVSTLRPLSFVFHSPPHR